MVTYFTFGRVNTKMTTFIKKYWLLFLLGVVVFTYVYLFVIPVQIAFAYDKSESCTYKISLFPDLYQQSSDNSGYEIYTEGNAQIAGVNFISTKVCIKPTAAPSSSTSTTTFSPLGGPFFANTFLISTGERPQLNTSLTIDSQHTIAKPIEFALDKADGLFEYSLEINNISTTCTNIDNIVSCDLNNLNLSQGKTYIYKLIRLFNGQALSDEVSGQITMLPPIKITESSVQNGDIVYSKPKTFKLRANKNITSADIVIEKSINDKFQTITSNLTIAGSVVSLAIGNDLDREAAYRIIVEQITGEDGSILEKSKTINFTTSGGPSVSNINIRSGGVDPNATVIVTFDQPISQSQDVSNIATITGGSASISRSGQQIIFKLQNISKCTAFTINIDQGLISNYGITSSKNWTYSSRVTCRTSQLIGYSVQGRAIYAYYYGSGLTNVLFTGGIHGSEFSGKYILDDLVTYLDSNAYKIPANKRVVVVPNLNPDGIAIGSRYNANNVNLDRNFDTTNWAADIETSYGIIKNGGGTEPMSEPETRAIADLTTTLRPRVEISYHAQGSLVGANQYGDSVAIGNLYASMVGYSSMIGIAEETMGYSITGEYEEWMGEQYDTPAILIELPTATGRYFWMHIDTIWKMINL
jgi:hypothetical protein